MFIIINFYKGSNTNYDNDGNVTLAPSKAIFKIKMNGVCEIEIEHPYDKEGRWKLIDGNGVIKAPTPYSEDGQLFPIYNIKKNLMKNGIVIQARHIFFDLIHSTIDDIRAVNSTGQQALNILLNKTKFTGHSDINTENTCYFVRNNIVALINGDKDNTFIKRWGGELFLDNYNIYLNHKIGDNYGAYISYGRNMLDLGIKENNDSIVTRIKPVAYNGRTLPDYGYVDSPLIDKYRIIYEKFIQMDNLKLKSDLQGDSSTNTDDGSIIFDTEEELYSAMRNKCTELFNSGIDKPGITGSVKVASLENTELYKDVKGLVNIGLGDTVTAYSELLDINLTTRCIGYEWDILTRKYNSIEIGDVVKNYFENQTDTSNMINKVLTGNGNIKSDMLAGLIDATKTQFKAMRDIAQQQKVRAMIFEDKIKGSSTYGALCLGTSGLEIADTRTPDDKDWQWSTFITGKSVIADYLIGTLKTVLIENMDGSFSIDLNKTGGALFKNDGKKAINIANNAINFYDWFDNEKEIGGLSSVTRTGDNTKALIQLNSSKQSAISIAAPDENIANLYNSLIEFDKYNILNNKKPICIYVDTSFLNNILYFGKNDENSFYSALSGYFVSKTKYGFGTVDKDSNRWTFQADGLNKTIAAWEWNNGNCYFTVSPTGFNLSNLIYTNSGTKNVATPNDFIVGGNFYVNGQKNRLVKTKHYGSITQNAYETCEAYFGDIGRAKLKNKKCIIRLDKKFLETVNTDFEYEVFVSPYGNGNVWVDTKKMYKQYVVVEGTADIEFAYEIKAKQKDYENIRLEEYKK